MEKYLAELNDDQRAATTAIDGPLLVVAGAGAGKTKTLTYRMLYMIQNGIPARTILGITFTNKAAAEMRERMQLLLNVSPFDYAATPLLCTFHSLGVRLLREHGHHVGYGKQFSILDRDDALDLIKDAYEREGVNPKELDPKATQSRISRVRGDGQTFADMAEGNYRDELIARIGERYEALKKESQSVDFDDLIRLPYEIIRDNADVRAWCHKQWSHIHVDEFQDTSKLQYELVKLLVGDKHNICVVGDSDQNIYSWRGAEIRNILNFERDFPGTRIVTLGINYRSTDTIVAASNAVIEKNTLRIPKDIRAFKSEGERICMYGAMSEYDEGRFVVEKIRQALRDGVHLSEMAILYRQHFQSRVLEGACIESTIPYAVVGTKFFERREIKEALAYVRAAFNRASFADYKRIYTTPKRGIGKVALAHILSGSISSLAASAKNGYDAVQKALASIGNANKNAPSEVMRKTLEASGLLNLYKDMGGEEGTERLLNLEELVSFAKRYDNLPENQFDAMLDDIALMSDADERDEKKDAVSMMTIHAAKGLEFKRVFVVGLEQGLFPAERMAKNVEEREEERRLMYVAMTRAKEMLYLTYAATRTIYGKQGWQTPSEFLADIPPEYVCYDGNSDPSDASHVKTVYLDW